MQSPFWLPFSLSLFFFFFFLLPDHGSRGAVSLIRHTHERRQHITGVPRSPLHRRSFSRLLAQRLFTRAGDQHQAYLHRWGEKEWRNEGVSRGWEKAGVLGLVSLAPPRLCPCLSNSFSPLSSDPLRREESWKACENRRCLFSFHRNIRACGLRTIERETEGEGRFESQGEKLKSTLSRGTWIELKRSSTVCRLLWLCKKMDVCLGFIFWKRKIFI